MVKEEITRRLSQVTLFISNEVSNAEMRLRSRANSLIASNDPALTHVTELVSNNSAGMFFAGELGTTTVPK